VRTIQRDHPDTREAAIGFLVDSGHGVGGPFSIGGNLRVAGLFESEIIFGGDAAALRQSDGREGEG
jgi:hypothetical protein